MICLKNNYLNRYYGYSIYSDEKYCLITSLSESGSLKDVLRSRLLRDENELLSILKQISEGVHYLHSDYRNRTGLTRPPIAHRDLKSDNILYRNSNEILISDFAMSTVIEQKHYQANQEQQVYSYIVFLFSIIDFFLFNVDWNTSIYVSRNFSWNNRM